MTSTTGYIDLTGFERFGPLAILLLLWLTLKHSLNQTSQRTNMALGKFYFERGRYRTAEDYFASAIPTLQVWDAQTREAMYARAICAQQHEDHHSALSYLKVMTMEEASYRVLMAMAISFAALEMHDQAEIAARAAHLKEPLDNSAAILLGTALFSQGKLTYSRITFEVLLSEDKPEILPVYQNLFEILCYELKFRQALEVAERMLRMAKQLPTEDNIALCRAFYAMMYRIQHKANIWVYILTSKGEEYMYDIIRRLASESSRFEPQEKLNVLELGKHLFPNFDIQQQAAA